MEKIKKNILREIRNGKVLYSDIMKSKREKPIRELIDEGVIERVPIILEKINNRGTYSTTYLRIIKEVEICESTKKNARKSSKKQM